MTNPTIVLRRDFADELGFGDFLISKQAVRACEGRAEFNRRMGLSPDLPRFLCYFYSDGQGRITADGELIFATPFPGIFEDMVRKAEAAAAEDQMWSDAAAACERQLTLEADEDGRPVLALLHDTHTNAAYLMDAEAAFGVLNGQP